MTALVSFDRVFEVLDLKPLIEDRPDAMPLVLAAQGNGSARTAGPAADIVFDHVSFHYPAASEVSLASLESIALPAPERTDAQLGVLHDVSFTAPARQLTALVGPSGAGKTTITHLVSRLYDPNEGTVRIGGFDLRDVTQESLHDTVGVVTQDAHLFHDTIRANLEYARPGVTEAELIEACRAAQIWDLISVLPDGLDTIVGDRGYRLSGGEKQRVALARLLLKAPAVVRARRGHRASRLRVGGRRPASARPRPGRPHLAGHRPPAVHHPRGRPDPGHRRRPGPRARPARRAARGREGCTPTCTGPSSPARSPSAPACGQVRPAGISRRLRRPRESMVWPSRGPWRGRPGPGPARPSDPGPCDASPDRRRVQPLEHVGRSQLGGPRVVARPSPRR